MVITEWGSTTIPSQPGDGTDLIDSYGKADVDVAEAMGG
jgi:hypothetical protein